MEGLIPIDTVLQATPRKRFRIERVAFLAVIAAAASPWGAPVVDRTPPASLAGGALWVFVSLVAVYAFADQLFGVGGGFREELTVGQEVPRFDWRRLVAEPVRLVIVLVVFAVGIGLIALARSCGPS
jgi:hypothetical protein